MTGGFVHKRCPRCGGNVYQDEDCYGWYEKCFQCAYTRDLYDVVEIEERINGGDERTAFEKELQDGVRR
jgi:hypothetical protein